MSKAKKNEPLLTHGVQRSHPSLALQGLVGHIGLSSRSLNLVPLVGKAQGCVRSFYGAGVNLAGWVEIGSGRLATRYRAKGAT